MLVLVLGWTQCLPQGVGAPPAMLRDAQLASPKNWAAGPPEKRGRWIQFAQCSPRLWHTNHEQAVSVWCMWLTSGRVSGRKTLLQYSSLTPLERECYEGEVQPYRKTGYKPIIYIYIYIYTHTYIYISWIYSPFSDWLHLLLSIGCLIEDRNDGGTPTSCFTRGLM